MSDEHTDDEMFFAALSERADIPALGAEETKAVLALARVAAHRHQRRFAPLLSYAAGLTLAADQDPASRAQRLNELLGILRELPEGLGAPSSPPT